MNSVENKFTKLGVDNAPGQEKMDNSINNLLIGENIVGETVDFSHGDVDAFKPIPKSLETFIEGFNIGSRQAYTEYKGKDDIRVDLAKKLSIFTNTKISAENQLIITPGTQGALFLAMGSLIDTNDKVAIVTPDYFANRKIAEFFNTEIIPVTLNFLEQNRSAGLDLCELENAFKAGAKVFLFSNPNNPTGVIYSTDEIKSIATLAKKYDVSVIVDQLYSRQIFDNRSFTHLCAQSIQPDNIITIIGPSKTESLSGFRLGVAYGSKTIISRMEKLQAIVSLRANGYSQSVLKLWFNEPDGWMKERILAHQKIRDNLMMLLTSIEGIEARLTEAGSYLFIKIPDLTVTLHEFIKILRIQANVTITPGTEFGAEYTNSFRINFSQDHQKAVSAINRTIELIKRYRA